MLHSYKSLLILIFLFSVVSTELAGREPPPTNGYFFESGKKYVFSQSIEVKDLENRDFSTLGYGFLSIVASSTQDGEQSINLFYSANSPLLQRNLGSFWASIPLKSILEAMPTERVVTCLPFVPFSKTTTNSLFSWQTEVCSPVDSQQIDVWSIRKLKLPSGNGVELFLVEILRIGSRQLISGGVIVYCPLLGFPLSWTFTTPNLESPKNPLVYRGGFVSILAPIGDSVRDKQFQPATPPDPDSR